MQVTHVIRKCHTGHMDHACYRLIYEVTQVMCVNRVVQVTQVISECHTAHMDHAGYAGHVNKLLKVPTQDWETCDTHTRLYSLDCTQ